MATKGVNPFMKFEKSSLDKEPKGMKEGSKKEEAMDKKQAKGRFKFAEGGVTEGPNENIGDDSRDRAMAWLAKQDKEEEAAPPPAKRMKAKKRPAPAPAAAPARSPTAPTVSRSSMMNRMRESDAGIKGVLPYAKGGSIDGMAHKGKTKGRMC